MVLVINPFLYFKSDPVHGFVLQDAINKRTFSVSPHDIAETTKLLLQPSVSNEKDSDIALLNTSRLLVEEDSREMYLGIRSRFWDTYENAESKYYHALTYNYPFLDYKQEESMDVDGFMMAIYEQEHTPPSPFKQDGEYQHVIELRRPDKNYTVNTTALFSENENILKKNCTIDTLEYFFYVSFGKTNTESTHVRKTTPSGGGKHPTEVYLLFPDDVWFPAGLYHYNVEHHTLECIRTGNMWETFTKATYKTLETSARKRFAVVYTSRVERAMWRYRDVRSTRAILADLGHVLQGAQLNAWAVGLDYGVEYNMREPMLKEILNLDEREPILAVQTFFQ